MQHIKQGSHLTSIAHRHFYKTSRITQQFIKYNVRINQMRSICVNCNLLSQASTPIHHQTRHNNVRIFPHSQTKFFVQVRPRSTGTAESINTIVDPFTEAFEIESNSRTVSECNEEILALKNDKKMILAETKFVRMKTDGVQPNTQTYNLLLDMYMTTSDFESNAGSKIWSLYNEMIESGIPQDTITHTTAIKGLCNREIHVRSFMERVKTQPWQKSVMDSMRRDNFMDESNIERAYSIFTATKDNESIKYNIDTCNTLMRALASKGLVEEALTVFEVLESRDIKPTQTTFSALIEAYGNAGDADSALACMQEYQAVAQELTQHGSRSSYHALIRAYVKCKKIPEAYRLIESMSAAGIPPDTGTYDTLIRAFFETGEYRLAYDCFLEMQTSKDTPKPDSSIYRLLLFQYSVAGDYEIASKFFSEITRRNITPSYTELAVFIHLTLEHDNKRVSALYEKMLAYGLYPDIPFLETVISRLMSKNNMEDALLIYELTATTLAKDGVIRTLIGMVPIAESILNDPQVRLHDALKLMRIFAVVNNTIFTARREFQYARRLFRFDRNMSLALLQKYELARKTEGLGAIANRDYNLLVEALIRAGGEHFENITAETFKKFAYYIVEDAKKSEAPISFKEMEKLEKGMMTVCGKGEAEKLLLAMDAEKLRQPSQQDILESDKLFAAVSNVLTTHPSVVLEMVKDMVSRKIYPVPDAMGSAIRNVGKVKDIAVARELYDIGMEVANIWAPALRQKAQMLARNALLYSYATVGQVEQALEIYQEIIAEGAKVQANCYAAMLLARSETALDQGELAIEIYEEAKRQAIGFNTYFYNVLISKLGAAGDLDMVHRVYEEMRAHDIQPNSVTFGALIYAYLRAGDEHRAIDTFVKMRRKFNNDKRTGPYKSIIEYYVRDNPNREKALHYFDEIQQRNLPLTNDDIWNLVIETYAAIEPYDMQTALSVLDRMKAQSKISPTVASYATLIRAYGVEHGDVDNAIRMFDSITSEHNLQLTPIAYHALMEGLIANNKLDLAVEYRKRMTEENITTTTEIENMFIQAYGRAKRWQEAEAAFLGLNSDLAKKSGSNNVRRDAHSYENMLRAYLDSGRPAEANKLADEIESGSFPKSLKRMVSEIMKQDKEIDTEA